MKEEIRVKEIAKLVSLFLMVATCAVVWSGYGILTSAASQHIGTIFTIAFLVILGTSLSDFTKKDWLWTGFITILMAVPIIFYQDNMGYLRFYSQIPFVLAFIFFGSKVKMDKKYCFTFLGFSSLYSVIALVKMILATFEIGSSSLWMNVNLIAGSVLFVTMLGIIMLDKLETEYTVIFQLILAVVAMMTVLLCKSWTSMIALFIFVALMFIIKFVPAIQKIAKKRNFWLSIYSGLFIFAPVISYVVVAFDGFGTSFSGRVDIWMYFFRAWKNSTSSILIGMKGTFHDPVLNLPAHNAYLDVLGAYGLIGYILLFGGILGLLFWRKQKEYSINQVISLSAFLMVGLHAFMENYLNSFHWISLLFIFLAVFISQSNEAELPVSNERVAEAAKAESTDIEI
ncbi:EpaQ family protein [Enterococcus sp. LJL51]|uniref:EpaQ family protein n=1 Tax=Enterococcus sp. LJL51 TaxID=3416656 RepID=UPI003CEAD294